MQLQHSGFQGLGLTNGISQQTQCIQALCLLHRFFQIKLSLLESPHGLARFRGLGDPAGRARHILNPVELRLVPQHLAQVLLLLFRQFGELSHQGGNSAWWQQVLLGALADFLRQQGTGGGREFVGQTTHLLARDLLTFIGRFGNHQLDLGISLGRFHEGPLGELIDA